MNHNRWPLWVGIRTKTGTPMKTGTTTQTGTPVKTGTTTQTGAPVKTGTTTKTGTPVKTGTISTPPPPKDGSHTHIGSTAFGSGAYKHVPDSALHKKYNAPVSKAEKQKSYDRYRKENKRFTRHYREPVRVSAHDRRIFDRVRVAPETYYYRRGVFYDHYHYAPPPYVYNMYPRYGIYDTMFLAFMLDNIAQQQYALMYYNHMNEVPMMQWRQDMDNQAATDDSLRDKLAVMDQQVANLQGAPADNEYVPPDAADVALSADAIGAVAGAVADAVNSQQ